MSAKTDLKNIICTLPGLFRISLKFCMRTELVEVHLEKDILIFIIYHYQEINVLERREHLYSNHKSAEKLKIQWEKN